MGHTFYIDLIPGARGDYKRLQKDGSYRSLTDPQPKQDDRGFSSVYKIIQFQQANKKIVIDDKEFILNPTSSSNKTGNIIFCSIYVDRDYFPLTPAKEQMISLLKFGNDKFYNSLTLNIYGLFELRHFEKYDLSLADPTVVVRNETFAPNNSYVGRNAALDTSFVNHTYRCMLEFWLVYLRTGRGGYYCTGSTTRSEIEILSEIEELSNVK